MAKVKQIEPLPLKKAVLRLREMDDALSVKDAQDADRGQPINTTRKEYRRALATAIAMMNDYLHTGAPSTHWLKGQQVGLNLSAADTAPITGQNGGIEVAA